MDCEAATQYNFFKLLLLMHSLEMPFMVKLGAKNFPTSLLLADIVPLLEVNPSHVLDQIILQCKPCQCLATFPLLAVVGPDILMDSFNMGIEMVFAKKVLLAVITMNEPLFPMHPSSVSFQVAFVPKPQLSTSQIYFLSLRCT